MEIEEKNNYIKNYLKNYFYKWLIKDIKIILKIMKEKNLEFTLIYSSLRRFNRMSIKIIKYFSYY